MSIDSITFTHSMVSGCGKPPPEQNRTETVLELATRYNVSDVVSALSTKNIHPFERFETGLEEGGGRRPERVSCAHKSLLDVA